jgi:branched-subunit amino acid transport protein
MSAYLVVATVGVASYLLRYSMIGWSARLGGVPPAMQRVARDAIPISFAALAASALLPQMNSDASTLGPVAGLVAAVIAVRQTGSPRAAIITGMPTLWLVALFVR